MDALLWVGRILFSMIFIMSGLSHLMGKGKEYAEMKGVPAPGVMVPLTGLVIVLGGLSVLLWYRVDVGALLLIGFLVVAAFKMHDFWAQTDPMAQQTEMAMFMKNMSMAGAALVFWVLYRMGV